MFSNMVWKVHDFQIFISVENRMVLCKCVWKIADEMKKQTKNG